MNEKEKKKSSETFIVGEYCTSTGIAIDTRIAGLGLRYARKGLILGTLLYGVVVQSRIKLHCEKNTVSRIGIFCRN